MPAHDPAIRVRNPGKKYTIGGPQEKYDTFRDAIVNFCEGAVQPGLFSESFWVLKDLRPDVGKRVLCVSHMGFSTPEPTSYLP